MLGLRQSKNEFNNQFVFFHTLHTLTSLAVWGYFAILLLRSGPTPLESVPLVVQYHGIYYITLLAGFWFSGKLLSVIGYLDLYRISNFISILSTLAAFLLLDHITEVFLLIAAVNGVASGIFWNLYSLYNTRELHGQERARWASLLFSLETVLTVILPVMIGSIITGYGYRIVFIIGALVYTVGIIYPWNANKIPKDKLRTADFGSLSKKRGFKRWAGLMWLEGLTDSMRTIVLAVLPFLFIGNEFGVGALGSAVGLAGALVAFLYRNDNLKHKLQKGYFGAVIVFLSTAGLIIFWSLPALVIRSLLVKFGFALHTPSHTEIKYRVREVVIGDFKDEYAVEIQQFGELFLCIARLTVVTAFLVAFYSNIQIEVVLMVFLGISLIREPVSLYWGNKIIEDLKIGPIDVYPQTIKHTEHAHPVEVN